MAFIDKPTISDYTSAGHTHASTAQGGSLGVVAATSINKVAITSPATSATLTIANGATLTASATATVSGTNTGDQVIREKLTAARTYYVATTGNNANPGTSGSPWETIQYAYDYIASNIDLAGYTVAIQLADGNYTAGLTVSTSWTGGGNITIQGNTGNSSSVILTTTSASNFVINAALVGVLTIQYLKLKTITSGDCIQHNNTGTIKFGNIVFDACARYHMYSAYPGASIVAIGNYSVIGGCSAHMICESAAMIRAYSLTITVTGNFTVGLSWAFSTSTANIQTNATYNVTGTITGKKYTANTNSVIYTAAGGADYFPGNSAGTTDTFGVYS